MQQIGKDFINFFVNLWSGLWSFFSNIENYLIRVILIYIIIIIFLSFWLRYSKKTFAAIILIFDEHMDNLYYDASLRLYNHKDDIHDFSNTIPLLWKYKTEEFTKMDKANYYEHYEKLRDEIEYIWQLVNESITYDRAGLDTEHKLIIKISNNIKYIKRSLLGLTLGIAKFFL